VRLGQRHVGREPAALVADVTTPYIARGSSGRCYRADRKKGISIRKIIDHPGVGATAFREHFGLLDTLRVASLPPACNCGQDRGSNVAFSFRLVAGREGAAHKIRERPVAPHATRSRATASRWETGPARCSRPRRGERTRAWS